MTKAMHHITLHTLHCGPPPAGGRSGPESPTMHVAGKIVLVGRRVPDPLDPNSADFWFAGLHGNGM